MIWRKNASLSSHIVFTNWCSLAYWWRTILLSFEEASCFLTIRSPTSSLIQYKKNLTCSQEWFLINSPRITRCLCVTSAFGSDKGSHESKQWLLSEPYSWFLSRRMEQSFHKSSFLRLDSYILCRCWHIKAVMFHLYWIVLCFVIALDIISLFGANLLVLLWLIAGWLSSLFLQMVMDDLCYPTSHGFMC